jgi:dTDP-4-amino-4,6-dideoxygalactose transaminase
MADEYGVGSGMYYPIPNHRLPSFAQDLDLPETERAAREALSLPVHPALTQADLDRVVEAVNALAKAGA